MNSESYGNGSGHTLHLDWLSEGFDAGKDGWNEQPPRWKAARGLHCYVKTSRWMITASVPGAGSKLSAFDSRLCWVVNSDDLI